MANFTLTRKFRKQFILNFIFDPLNPCSKYLFLLLGHFVLGHKTNIISICVTRLQSDVLSPQRDEDDFREQPLIKHVTVTIETLPTYAIQNII